MSSRCGPSSSCGCLDGFPCGLYRVYPVRSHLRFLSRSLVIEYPVYSHLHSPCVPYGFSRLLHSRAFSAVSPMPSSCITPCLLTCLPIIVTSEFIALCCSVCPYAYPVCSLRRCPCVIGRLSQAFPCAFPFHSHVHFLGFPHAFPVRSQ